MMKKLFLLSALLFGSLAQAQTSAVELAADVAERHGGLWRWQQQEQFYVGREHHFLASGHRFVFDIHQRQTDGAIKQQWQQPPGQLYWHQNQAWSQDWPLKQGLLPAFVLSIGYYLANMPFLAADAAEHQSDNLQYLGLKPGLHPDDKRAYHQLRFDFQAPMLSNSQDWFVLFIDPQTHLLKGVHQHRRWPPQLARMGDIEDFFEIYVPNEYLYEQGMLYPGSYRIYSADGSDKAQGRFHSYAFNRPLSNADFPSAPKSCDAPVTNDASETSPQPARRFGPRR